MTSLKTLLAAALVASSATVAFASDNGDGARQLDGVRNVQQNPAITMTEGRNAAITLKTEAGTTQGSGKSDLLVQVDSLAYRGSAN